MKGACLVTEEEVAMEQTTKDAVEKMEAREPPDNPDSGVPGVL